MWRDRVSNPGPPTYKSGALPIALRGPAGISLTGPLEDTQYHGKHLSKIIMKL